MKTINELCDIVREAVQIKKYALSQDSGSPLRNILAGFLFNIFALCVLSRLMS